jgi:hypothetical protein
MRLSLPSNPPLIQNRQLKLDVQSHDDDETAEVEAALRDLWVIEQKKLRRLLRGNRPLRKNAQGCGTRHVWNDKEPESCFGLHGSFGPEGPQDDSGMQGREQIPRG